jgi:integrase
VIFDAKVRGLCLRVTARTKSWSFIYRPRGLTKQRRLTIGDYPAWSLFAARDKALNLRRVVQDGGDPKAEAKAKAEALTVRALVDRFIERHAKKKLRTWKEYAGVLNRNVTPVLGDRRAGEVTRADIADLLDKIADRAPVVSNRTLNILSSVYSWAVSEGLVPSNPVTGLKRRHAEVAKERFLSDHEIRAFWRVTETISAGYRDALRLILLTGQRPGECTGMMRSEIDRGKGLWTLPPARTKNKTEHRLPLIGEAFRIVDALAGKSRIERLIITPRGKPLTSQNLARAVGRLFASTFSEPMTPHDLRRTAATIMGRLDIDHMTIARVLNHASTTKRTVTGSVYDRHDYLPQKRRALEALEAEVHRILSGTAPAANVDPMPARAP